ncbi:MAG: lysostaphin resistance A-like protein [Candidatus Omnitrophota bacterium]
MKIRKIILENEIYLWLIFLSLALGIFSYLNRDNLEIARVDEVFKERISQFEEITPQDFVKNIEENIYVSYLFKINFLIGFFVFVFGIYLCLLFLSKLFKRNVSLFSQNFPEAGWQVIDIFRVIVVIVFFINFLKVIEPVFLKTFEVDLFVYFIVRVFLFDIFCLGVIFYFVFKKYRLTFYNLGLKLDNFINNLLIVFPHYIGIIPVLFLTVIITFFLTDFFKYKPEISPLFYFFFLPQPKYLIFFTAVFIAIIGPVIEEVFFRGFCYPALRKRFGPLKAMFLVSFFFALLHMNVIGFLPIFTLGLLLVYLYEKTNSLISPIGLHILHNSLILYLIFLYRMVFLK